jgi:hypothetical protein
MTATPTTAGLAAGLPLLRDGVLASPPGVAGVRFEVTGGSALLVGVTFLLLAAATVLSLLITYRYARGYLESGARPLLGLAVGLFFLTAAPTFLRLAFANTVDAPTWQLTAATSVSELLGLVAILYTIYR